MADDCWWSMGNATVRTSKHIVIVEDSVIFREAWNLFTKIPVKSYSHPEAFLEAVGKDSGLLADAEGLILDNYFDELSAISGADLTLTIRSMGFEGPIMLSSCGEFATLPPGVDAHVGKMPDEVWEEIQKLNRR